FQETGVFALLQRLMEDVYGIIRGAAAGSALPTDQAGVAQAAHINTISLVIIGAPLFAGLLAYTIYRCGFGDRVLRGKFLRRGGAENRDAAGPVDLPDLSFTRHLQYMEEAFHVQFPG